MKKEDFKNAIENSTPLVWLSMKNQKIFPIIGVDRAYSKDENWGLKPINILYLEMGETPEETRMKPETAYLWEIDFAEKVFPDIKQHIRGEGMAKRDESVAPLQNKISNN